MQMKRNFRKYHRILAPIIFLPLALTALTGIAVTTIEEWHWNLGISQGLLLQLHTGELFHLGGIYPILNGLGVIGLLVTGISMTGIFRSRSTN